MAIKFQYNKTSLGEMRKKLQMRQRALPTIKSKESALRLEVKNPATEGRKMTKDRAKPHRYSPTSWRISLTMTPIWVLWTAI